MVFFVVCKQYLSPLVLRGFLLKKGVALPYIGFISGIAFVIGLLGDSYYGVIEPLKSYFIPYLLLKGYEAIFFTTRNGIFFGLIFVWMGALFAQKRIVINNSIAFIGFVISMFGMLIEVYLLKRYSHPKDYNMYVSLLPAEFFLFYITTHLNLKNRPFYSSLRIIGLIIYFTHLFVAWFVTEAIKIAKIKTGINLTRFRFIIVICLTTMLAVIIERLSKKDKFIWLKYLFT